MAKLPKGIQDDLLRYIGFIQESLDDKLAQKIGDAVVNEMILMVKRGISPIEGAGRFPEYKWATVRKELKKEKSRISRELKRNKKALFVLRRMNQRQLLVRQKEQARRDISGVSGRYPFTKEAIEAGKKPRPVNLTLHGDFLNALQAKVTGTFGAHGIEVGFFPGWKDDKGVEAYTKEEGHREGANGQPKRPIIPIGTEDFAQRIQNIIWEIIEEEIDRAAAVGAS